MDAWAPITTKAKLSLPLNGTVHTTTRKVAAENKVPDLGSTMATILGQAFAASRVIEATELPDGDGGKTQTVVHALIPTEAEQLLSNWEFATCSIGGQKFNGITRTLIYPAAEFSATAPALASAMPIGTDNLFTGAGYILTGRNAARSGMQLEPVFKVEVREYVKRVTMANVGIDSNNGLPLFESTTLYHASEVVAGSALTAAALFAAPSNAFWGIQATGFENTASQLSAEWYAFTSSQVVAGVLTAGVVMVSENVPTNDEYTWPAVLQHVDFMDWKKREGGEETFPLIVFKHDAYRGPCRTVTTRTWSKAPFVIPVAGQMLPNSIDYHSPFFSLSIPRCLHEDVPCRCDIGSDDPKYTQNAGSLRVFLATTPPDWPPYIVAYDDQEQYRGGYLRTRRLVYSPEGSGGGSPTVIVPPPTSLGFISLTSSSVVILWISDFSATSHILEVALDSGFSNLIIYREPLDMEQEALSALAHSTTYWARVSTLAGAFKSAPCAPITFTTPA